ncbi:hypothetical protein BT96DRAFT_1014319 [Gymnopus androsaceus JB14]|uniref:MYND-type domain-containing protein n=1 Tax=Gymnopus androsaceus JB14 TaxID=1447944 RepID=A0A6A4I5I4_9AGAR|nr:hypothetical protein BT96DRAFT_1014319 [Gymnopus androsaceus JB14]
MMAQDRPPWVCAPEHTMLEVAGDMLCSWCFQPSGAHITLKKCSLCHRVSYCSPACQKKDWKLRHKHYCPRFQEVNKYDLEIDGESSVTLAELVKRQDERREILKSINPDQHEPCEACATTIFKREVVCEVCFKTPYQTRPIKSFASCPKCQLARYCSDKCKLKLPTVHSKEQCDMLALLHATKRTDIDYHLDRKRLRDLGSMMNPSPKKHGRYVPMASYTGWDHYHRALSQEASGIADIAIMYGMLASSFRSHSPQAVAGVGQLSTESESFPFTMISGLEKAIPKISTCVSLSIHVVGASSRELGTSGMAEEILHHFPRLKHLHLRFIGPEAIVPTKPDNRACPDCQAVGGRRTWSTHTEVYHDYIRQNPRSKPDLIVALNSGHSDITLIFSWMPTLEKILDMNVPALFTEYLREEAEYEVARLRSMGARIVVWVGKEQMERCHSYHKPGRPHESW